MVDGVGREGGDLQSSVNDKVKRDRERELGDAKEEQEVFGDSTTYTVFPSITCCLEKQDHTPYWFVHVN